MIFLQNFLSPDKLSRFPGEEMYSGIHVFSLANILKTGEQGVKESINNILQLNKKKYFWHFADSS